MMHEYRVDQVVTLTLMEEAFTPEFMTEFSESILPFETITDHAEHLAQLIARGLVGSRFQLVEGYGELSQFVTGFKVEVTDVEIHA